MSLDQNHIESILIVGGGSAGWITANLLNAYLNPTGAASLPISVTLLESPDIPAIGVGEATVPSIRDTLLKIGLGEKEFMRATDATFKSAIRFTEWNPGQEFDHPFDRRSRAATNDQVEQWFALNRAGRDFAKQFSLLSNLCDLGLAPKGVSWPDYNSAFPYAYHLDANKLAATLTEHGKARGIRHVLGTVERVTISEQGEISEVLTDTGAGFAADLYVDCTGFAAKLISELEANTFDYSDTLLCDRALTVQIPFEVSTPATVNTYTKAIARAAGWNWDINLRNRRGVGYVYSGSHLSDDAAYEELAKIEGPHLAALNVRQVRFKSYKRARSWAGNCVAIGLSDCFIEPLESSGLFMIEFAAHLLAESIQDSRSAKPSTSRHFNRVMQGVTEEVLDFVSLHYLTSNRSDTEFWRDATDPGRASDLVRDLLIEWKTRSLRDTDMIALTRLFSFESFEYLLYGMDYYQKPAARSNLGFDHSLSNELQRCQSTLPKHEDWLRTLDAV